MARIQRETIDLVFDLPHYHGARARNDGKPSKGDPEGWRYRRLLERVILLVDEGLIAERERDDDR